MFSSLIDSSQFEQPQNTRALVPLAKLSSEFCSPLLSELEGDRRIFKEIEGPWLQMRAGLGANHMVMPL